MNCVIRGIVVLITSMAILSSFGIADTPVLDMEQRVEYPLRLERLAHKHRIASVPEPKTIFEALDNDPYVIAKCLARPIPAARLARN